MHRIFLPLSLVMVVTWFRDSLYEAKHSFTTLTRYLASWYDASGIIPRPIEASLPPSIIWAFSPRKNFPIREPISYFNDNNFLNSFFWILSCIFRLFNMKFFRKSPEFTYNRVLWTLCNLRPSGLSQNMRGIFLVVAIRVRHSMNSSLVSKIRHPFSSSSAHFLACEIRCCEIVHF